MTARRIANRANAAHSTGPRTHRGKARASRNALRHGLAAARLADSDTLRIARLICDPRDLLAHDQALIIAECCSLLARIRQARAAALERMALNELSALERYERRALSRRRRAIRVLASSSSARSRNLPTHEASAGSTLRSAEASAKAESRNPVLGHWISACAGMNGVGSNVDISNVDDKKNTIIDYAWQNEPNLSRPHAPDRGCQRPRHAHPRIRAGPQRRVFRPLVRRTAPRRLA